MLEYNHYVRLIVADPLSSHEVRNFFFAVKHNLEQAKVDPKDDVIVIYNTPEDDDSIHRYDIPLTQDMSAQEGDTLARALSEIFDMDWELESSTDLNESAQYMQESVIYLD